MAGLGRGDGIEYRECHALGEKNVFFELLEDLLLDQYFVRFELCIDVYRDSISDK